MSASTGSDSRRQCSATRLSILYDCKFQLDDTLTDKEINALLKYLNPKGAVAEHLNFAKKANEMGQDALWKLREEVKDTCKAINDLCTNLRHAMPF